jgi:pyruvate ferredoxin oxidoreductase gamma subunit
VVVADETLVPVPAAGVMAGVVEGTVVLIDSHKPGEEWRRRLNAPGSVLALPAPAIAEHEDLPLLGVACAGAAARLLGCVSPAHLERAIRAELPELSKERLARNLETAREAYETMAPHEGVVSEAEWSMADCETRPAWVDVPLDAIERAGPAVYGGATSVEVRTGLWRILRPVIDLAQCNRCIWVCGTFCPDNAIAMDEDGYPAIDYEHCKGCMICLAQCPPHAIHAVPEFEAQAREREEAAA